MKQQIFRLLTIFLVFLLLFSSCVNRVYPIAQVMDDQNISQRMINKRVLITGKDNKKLAGYLKTIESDSLTIVQIKQDKISERKIATENIKAIRVKKKANPLISLGIVSVFVFIILMSRINTNYLSGLS